ncbi:ABC-2 transporter permease [Bacilliculturomica massiliensis]|uniref:ABC-2 transporter permease n=1 Tax=Bacilliculturomica massiliensis TaxID=1917867 RepID=UPI001031C84A|nr:ABC-2 transporter permease [Bacilliculturomica massiliensis]
MKGLMLKDYYNLRKSGKTIIAIMLIYAVFGAVSGQISFMSAIVAILCATLPISTFSYDDFSKWDSYALSMPVTRRQIILAKYLLSLIMILLGCLVSLLSSFAALAFAEDADAGPLEVFSATGAVALVCLLMLSIIFPVIVKYGVEKGRIAMIAVFLVPTLLGLLAARMGLLDNLPSADLKAMLIPALIAAPIAVVLLFVLSFALSLHLYSKKEF